MRALLALPVIAGVALLMVDRFWATRWTMEGTELVEVRVLDDAGGRPIAGAAVRITPSVEGSARTGPDGTAAFAAPYRFEGRASPFREVCEVDESSAIDLIAEGYAPWRGFVAAHRVGGPREAGFSEPIVVRLRRSP